VLTPIWEKKHETATRLRGRIESVLDFAAAAGYRTGDNPARLRGNLRELLPRIQKKAIVTHHLALPYARIGDLMAKLRNLPEVGARALEFTILTAVRTSELRQA
jgi:hypothetical protein